MSSRSRRSSILVLVFLASLATPAFAAMRDGDAPRDPGWTVIRRVVRVVKKLLVQANSEMLSIPKP